MAEQLSPALRAVSDAVLAVASQRSVEEVLQRLVDRSRELVDARYAALGIPDGDGGFSRFLVSGMSDELVAALGPLPRTHGMLGAMLDTREPFRTPDIHTDPRFRGWWPAGHPDMRSFLGVPIIAAEGVIGAFYLTDKEGAAEFGAADQELIELLASHAAIAITNARLYERSRELSVLSERNRLALELHDAVSQKLFSVVLTAEAATTLLERDREAARVQIDRVGELAREALDELRSLIDELRPADLERDGLAGTLRKDVEVLRPLHAPEIEIEIAEVAGAGDPARDHEVLRIAQEAIQNALRHAAAKRVVVRLAERDDQLELEVADDGIGFDPSAPELRARRLGLTSMEERARRIDAELEIRSEPGRGTTVGLRRGRLGPCDRAESDETIRVLIVDDHAVVREGLRTFLQLQDGIQIVGEAGDGAQAIREAERLRPDVILIDLVMPKLDGAAAMRELRRRLPATKAIVLTSFGDDERLLPAIEAGAAGYLLKDAEPQDVVRAIRAADAGEALLDPSVAARLVAAIAQPAGEQPRERLTPREQEVLALIARGMPNKLIARELGIAEKTVKTHVGHVLAKLGVADRTQAALYAIRAGLAEAEPGPRS